MTTPNPFNMGDEFLKEQGTDPDTVVEVNSMAEAYEYMEKMLGDTMENLSKDFDVKINARLVNPRAQDWISDEEVEELIKKPAPFSQPFNLATDFKYSPLPKGYFRLLNIGGVGTSPLVEMKDFLMDKSPEYAAMSYAWGRETQSRAFFCNGQNFAVSGHVLDALNHVMRDYLTRKWVWIDAICINQADDDEKAIQVAAMQSIYCRAQEVLIWLGPSENNSDFVLDNVSTIKNWAHQRCLGNNIPLHVSASAQQQSRSLLEGLGHLYARPWFHRVWVVQELLLARNPMLFCGNRQVDWELFAEMTILVMGAGAIPFTSSPAVSQRTVELSARNILALSPLRRQGPILKGLSVLDFVELLDSCRSRQVTEPVDRVWAFLGLAPLDIQHATQSFIDYSPEGRRDYHKAYKSLVRFLLLRDPNLSILQHAPSLQVPLGLPSWCPNFHAARWNGGVVQFVDHPFKANGSDKVRPPVAFEPNSDILRLRGFCIDRVDKIVKLEIPDLSSWEEQMIPKPTIHSLFVWEQKCLQLAQKTYNLPGGIPEAHWRTLCLDHLHKIENRLAMKSAYLHYRAYLGFRSDTEAQEAENRLSPEAKQALGHYKGMVAGFCLRSYFSTRGGRVGLGPPRVETGDRIVILDQAKVPHILRLGVNGAPAKLVGDAYVHGIMHGEALKMDDRCEDEIFRID